MRDVVKKLKDGDEEEEEDCGVSSILKAFNAEFINSQRPL